MNDHTHVELNRGTKEIEGSVKELKDYELDRAQRKELQKLLQEIPKDNRSDREAEALQFYDENLALTAEVRLQMEKVKDISEAHEGQWRFFKEKARNFEVACIILALAPTALTTLLKASSYLFDETPPYLKAFVQWMEGWHFQFSITVFLFMTVSLVLGGTVSDFLEKRRQKRVSQNIQKASEVVELQATKSNVFRHLLKPKLGVKGK